MLFACERLLHGSLFLFVCICIIACLLSFFSSSLFLNSAAIYLKIFSFTLKFGQLVFMGKPYAVNRFRSRFLGRLHGKLPLTYPTLCELFRGEVTRQTPSQWKINTGKLSSCNHQCTFYIVALTSIRSIFCLQV